MARTPVYYDQQETVGRKCICSWRPMNRWPETHLQTHSLAAAGMPLFQGFIFRSEADAVAHDTSLLDPAFGPQPFFFNSWQEAEDWLKVAVVP